MRVVPGEGRHILAVNLLGKFQAINENGVLNDDAMRSEMLTRLLVYLLTHREHPLTIQELSEALWQEDETENPAGALKNLMYRLRAILKKTLGEDHFILTVPGGYAWNAEVLVVLDIEKFESHVNEGKTADAPEQKAVSYEAANKLYRGDFMPKLQDRHWAITMSAYYHSLFLSNVKNLSELYCEQQRYEEVERICTEALNYDRVDEQIYCYLIEAVMKQNKLKLAVEYYENAVKILYDALGVRNPARLKAVHKELLKMSKTKVAEDIVMVREDMLEEKPEGAFVCGYPVFREVYRLEARKVSRLGEAEYVVLLTVRLKRGKAAENEKMEQFLIGQAMKLLEEVLKGALRIGDVVARYSDSQYVILLPACTYECSMLVINRILAEFYEKSKSRRVQVKADFEQVTICDSLLVK